MKYFLNNLKFIYLTYFCSAYFLFTGSSFAQGCCTAGSSTFGGLERGLAKSGNLLLGVGFLSTSLNSTFNGIKKIEDPLNRTSSVASFNLEIEYGLSEKVSILISSGYVVKSRETTVRSNLDNSSTVINFEGNGIGDLIILGKYEILTPTILTPLGLTLGAGIKLPVGSYTQKIDGTRLAIDLQPGTGSTDALLWGNLYKGFQQINLALFLTALYRYAGSNLDGYRFGDEIIASIGSEYFFTEFLIFSLSAKARFSDKDFWGGRFLPSTGGVYIDLLPALSYSEGKYDLKAFYQMPLHRNVNGIQLTSSGVVGVELLFHFNLGE
ncbi:MAG: hypothetical protein ACUVT3_07175 [Ignavibacterium sp.]